MIKGVGLIVKPGEPSSIPWIVAGLLVMVCGVLGIWTDILLLEITSVSMGCYIFFQTAYVNHRVKNHVKNAICEETMEISYGMSDDGRFFSFVSESDCTLRCSDDSESRYKMCSF